ncbi:bacteriorhodopsin [Halogeometricum sp. S1BR25-6]|uniref:Bacteriorhodopsin n=1 Tax=Halogeometricum salsisoli TaxID=2950536 RepID=A0ABU2GA03_9EURY|nr:bacteriorhodopsin [Halogeometricum sp. S1BR25-6]MDS0297584.1 bacteriorhodopsin [Halogeometricum sp. S1BR25-6]
MATPGSEAIWLWIGTAGMFAGTMYFVARGWGVTDPKQQLFYVLSIFVTTIASVSYLMMATGFGLTQVEVGGVMLDIYWARYADWIFTTPLLLLDLALLAGANRNTMYTLVGLDVLMIATGAIAAFAASAPVRIAWWGVSTVLLLFLLYFLVQALNEAADRQTESVRSLTTRLRNMLIVLWLAYPVVWILGTEGTIGLLPLYYETAAFMVLDLVAKVGFGFILLRSHSVLDQVGQRNPAATPADD